MTMSSNHQPALTLQAIEVENAFMAACKANAIRNPEVLAALTQSVCCWHRLDEAGRSRVLVHIRAFFPIH